LQDNVHEVFLVILVENGYSRLISYVV